MSQRNTPCGVKCSGSLFYVTTASCHVLPARLSTHTHVAVAKGTDGQCKDPVNFTFGYSGTDFSV